MESVDEDEVFVEVESYFFVVCVNVMKDVVI